MKSIIFYCIGLLLITGSLMTGCASKGNFNNRNDISLNGEWELEETFSADSVPAVFSHTITVPGLADMAKPALDSIGYNLHLDRYLWYKKVFTLEENSPVVRLKINKAKFGTRIYVNGTEAGSRLYCFTPSVFEIQDYLNEPGEQNELLIRIGATPGSLPDTIPYGHDFEKIKYLPGIYDEVKLICSDRPFISNVQIAPDIENELIEVRVMLEGISRPDNLKLIYKISEDSTGNIVTEGEHVPEIQPDLSEGSATLTFTIPLAGTNLWTPERPFLYNLHLSTGSDNIKERFGMRTFRMDPGTGRAYLNGKPYFMRGTNVCIFRFFEDPQRGDLPWDKQWVRNLHRKFKSMHWNAIRYCIGFPPEQWYDIADEEGFLIQNEYPLWGNPKVTSQALTEAYQATMKEYWNHPCVAIWDAQNETITEASGKAIQNVRALDMSNRPWDNGWSPPQEITDAIETHPYLFSRYMNEKAVPPREYLHVLLSEAQIPGNGPSERSPKDDGRYGNAIIINEYGWLWLNRDATPTTLTDNIYKKLVEADASGEERFEFYARNLGMLTEYWRGHRKCAGVLHFCGLGYSRSDDPRGQTSDHFIDIKLLKFEPHFLKYVRPAFSPVGLMIDYWLKFHGPGTEIKFPVFIINDTETDYAGVIRLYMEGSDNSMEKSDEIKVPGLGRTIRDFTMEIPREPGRFQLTAEITYQDQVIKSIRDIVVE